MLTHEEILIVKKYQMLKIPTIYKMDDTDNLLFIEDVDFDICPALIKSKKFKQQEVEEITKKYATFLSQVSIVALDEDALYHFKVLNDVMSIFFKYNL